MNRMLRLVSSVAVGALLMVPFGCASFGGDDAIRSAIDLSGAFREAARVVDGAVVHIEPVVARPPRGSETRDEGEAADDRDGAPPRTRTLGRGTGVILRSDGVIVTNNHVINGADEIRVRLRDGRVLTAEMVGADPDTDLAVIRIDADGLPAASLGDSGSLQVGDWVLAVGSPFGLDHTVTAGIVSAKGRGGMGVATFENFIQTDAAINPGNSGGPLTNLAGEVVGINTAISSPTGAGLGVGFAIPSSMVRKVVESLLETGRVERGFLGVNLGTPTRAQVEALQARGLRGAVVLRVLDDTPADAAGLQRDDIITGVDGRSIAGSRQLIHMVADIPPGREVELQLLRDGELLTVRLRVGERPDRGRVR